MGLRGQDGDPVKTAHREGLKVSEGFSFFLFVCVCVCVMQLTNSATKFKVHDVVTYECGDVVAAVSLVNTMFS